ncbi:nitroreductase family protein [Tessaracoccus antarcticus]|uniref:Nitroreductase n=1 Tax=Tessaracoccus antarcticus TaxID=2479848 RepID=A0A3M0GBJ4_9ACTN|nr:nitroreductase family protein [Tessaracoccus antarcticus]RMB61757.1 nitroreductase [Tessaracoccus antarcticus]
MSVDALIEKTADTAAALHPLLAERWSPRGFDPRHSLDDVQLTALLEAARWAPSANNSQPWRFVAGRRGDEVFDQLAKLLLPGNQTWAPAASALILAAARTVNDTGRVLPWALYDTGQAIATLTVQASADGLFVHQMGGFDADAARLQFDLGDILTPVVMVAVGRHDPQAPLGEPLATRERAPRTREALDALLLNDPYQRQRAA